SSETVMSSPVSVKVFPSSDQRGSASNNVVSQASAPSRSGRQAIIVLARSDAFTLPSDRSTPPTKRLQPAVAEMRPSSGNSTTSGPSPGICVPVTLVETKVRPVRSSAELVSAESDSVLHAAATAARETNASTRNVRIMPLRYGARPGFVGTSSGHDTVCKFGPVVGESAERMTEFAPLVEDEGGFERRDQRGRQQSGVAGDPGGTQQRVDVGERDQVGGSGVAGVGGGFGRAEQFALHLDEFDARTTERDEPVQRFGVRAERRWAEQEALLELALAVVEQCPDESGAGAEPAEDGALADSGPRRDGVHRHG